MPSTKLTVTVLGNVTVKLFVIGSVVVPIMKAPFLRAGSTRGPP